jgi:hypothetical protein
MDQTTNATISWIQSLQTHHFFNKILNQNQAKDNEIQKKLDLGSYMIG